MLSSDVCLGGIVAMGFAVFGGKDMSGGMCSGSWS